MATLNPELRATKKPAPLPPSTETFDATGLLSRVQDALRLGTRRPSDARPAPALWRTVPAKGLEGQLFDVRARTKQQVAHLSMHLPPGWRGKVFRQIDDLLDVEEWEIGNQLLDNRSVLTFLRFVIYAGATTLPSLGLSLAGNIVAAWRRDTRRATIEFLPADRCRLVISHVSGEDPSILTFSGLVTAARGLLQRESFPLG